MYDFHTGECMNFIQSALCRMPILGSKDGNVYFCIGITKVSVQVKTNYITK